MRHLKHPKTGMIKLQHIRSDLNFKFRGFAVSSLESELEGGRKIFPDWKEQNWRLYTNRGQILIPVSEVIRSLNSADLPVFSQTLENPEIHMFTFFNILKLRSNSNRFLIGFAQLQHVFISTYSFCRSYWPRFEYFSVCSSFGTCFRL